MQMPTSRKDSGFTLIEMAIVLVIIGLIIGSVLKGQDLIQNARAKKFVTWARSWEVAQWNMLDRTGGFAGDGDKSGVMGDVDSEKTAANSTLADMAAANFINPPTNSTQLGSYKFYMYGGNDGATPSKNVMVITLGANTSTALFKDDYLIFAESLDTAIDGKSDPTDGAIQGFTSLSLANDVVTAQGTQVDTWAEAGAIVYHFDSK